MEKGRRRSSIPGSAISGDHHHHHHQKTSPKDVCFIRHGNQYRVFFSSSKNFSYPARAEKGVNLDFQFLER